MPVSKKMIEAVWRETDTVIEEAVIITQAVINAGYTKFDANDRSTWPEEGSICLVIGTRLSHPYVMMFACDSANPRFEQVFQPYLQVYDVGVITHHAHLSLFMLPET